MSGDSGIDIYEALKHAAEELVVVAGAALLMVILVGALKIIGAPADLIATVKRVHFWVIVFMVAYIPARFWAASLREDIKEMLCDIESLLEGVACAVKRLLSGVSEFAREEYIEWRAVLRESKRRSKTNDGGEREQTEAGTDDD